MDPLSTFFSIVFVLCAGVTTFISYEYLIWKIISLNIKYKFSKVNNIDKEIKQEKYKGFMLSLKLKIFKTKIINK